MSNENTQTLEEIAREQALAYVDKSVATFDRERSADFVEPFILAALRAALAKQEESKGVNNNITEAAERILELVSSGEVTLLALKIIIAECITVEQGQPTS